MLKHKKEMTAMNKSVYHVHVYVYCGEKANFVFCELCNVPNVRLHR